MCLLGDGTTNIGAFHESLNLAALWRLPIVYVIVNNQLGMGTPVEAASAEPDLWKRGCSYRMPGERVDGNDVLAVRDAARARRRAGPGRAAALLLEAVSYRLRGHSVVDPARYRSAEEPSGCAGRPAARVPRPAAGGRGPRRARPAAQIEAEADKAVDRRRGLRRRQPGSRTSPTLFAHVYATPVPNVSPRLPGDPVDRQRRVPRPVAERGRQAWR